VRLRLTLATADQVTVHLRDAQGRLVYTARQDLPAGTTELPVGMQSWPAQAYTLQVQSPRNGLLVTRQIIRQ
jgi:hypothetical protein